MGIMRRRLKKRAVVAGTSGEGLYEAAKRPQQRSFEPIGQEKPEAAKEAGAPPEQPESETPEH